MAFEGNINNVSNNHCNYTISINQVNNLKTIENTLKRESLDASKSIDGILKLKKRGCLTNSEYAAINIPYCKIKKYKGCDYFIVSDSINIKFR